MFANIALLIAALLLLTLGGELLVRGATWLAERAGLSSFFIGLTVVGFGTSAPELAASLQAVAKGHPDVNIGNIVGSNIFNIAVILAATALICPVPVARSVVRQQIPVMIAVSFLPYLALATGGVQTRAAGGLMAVALVFHLLREYRRDKADAPRESNEAFDVMETAALPKTKEAAPVWLATGVTLAGLALLAFGANWLIDSAVYLATFAGVPELVISLTIVAGGTSAPELVTSAMAAFRRKTDIAVGNIVGSNIFNMLAIGGITALVQPQTVPPQALSFDIPVMLAFSFAVIPIMLTQHRISRAEGVLLLLGYVIYLVTLYAKTMS